MNHAIYRAQSVEQMRKQAREHADDGAVTANYEGDVRATIELLNEALAAEIVCVLRYKFHYITASGIDSDSVRAEFLEHGQQEQDHADRIAQRINQLGGRPEMNPAGVAARSATEYREGNDLVEMITEDLVAERIAIESYRGWIRFLGDHDPTTRRLLEDILAQEEEHANDLHDLLVARQGSPGLSPTTMRSTTSRSELERSPDPSRELWEMSAGAQLDVERAAGEGMGQPQWSGVAAKRGGGR
jgi:bacterioferritin